MPLDEVVRRALTLDAFRAIWILEGVGHIRGSAHPMVARGLLTDGPGAVLSDRAMISLHAGMGTAFAEKRFAMLGSDPSPAAIRQTVQSFAEACRSNCRPGWEDACIEPIGLVVRCLYPSLLSKVSEEMAALSPALGRLFWHGVGRSLYFVPTNFMPVSGAHNRMFGGALLEASDPEDRRNIVAGLVWAVTLVNLRAPAIIRQVLPICMNLDRRDEFNNGLISALLAWRHMAPADVRYLSDYKNWSETPAREALDNLYPGLERNNRIPALYTYRTFDELEALGAPPTEQKI